MSKIAILTDSSCDIPQEMAEKYGIDIMSFHILLDDVDYVERESCTNTEFYDKMRLAKGVPSTAAITACQHTCCGNSQSRSTSALEETAAGNHIQSHN